MKTFKYLILTTFALQLGMVFAGEFKTGNPERKRSSSEAMTEMVYKKFVRFQEMIADEKYAEARAGLNALTQKRLNGFEKANVNQYIGYVDTSEGKYAAAVKRFQIAIDSDALPNQAHFNMIIQVAQILIADGEYQRGINELKKYYKVTDAIKDRTFALEANALAQLNKIKEAIPVIKKAISLSDKPNESWHYLLYTLHMQRSQFLEAAKVMETLITINPNKKDYWKRLSSVYFNLKKDDKALAALVVADENNLIKDEKDRLHLYKMYAYLGVPYKAGQVLEQGLKDGVIEATFKHWDKLGKTWYMAAEMDKALYAYNQASKLATDGKIDFQRAYIYFDREDWPKVKSALRAALEKGGLKDKKVGQAWLLLGMAQSETGNRKGAIRALKNATKFDGTKNNAVQWLNHIDQQIRIEQAAAERQKILEKTKSEEDAASS